MALRNPPVAMDAGIVARPTEEPTTMRSACLRPIVALACVLALSDSRGVAFGNFWRTETVYVAPSSTVLGVPTSYVVPTTYANVYPTSYVVPTLYSTAYIAPTYTLSPTAYVVPTYYQTTSYLLPRRFLRRPIYETTTYYSPTSYYAPTVYTPTVYYPSSYYYPTVYDYPIVASSATSCCGGVASAPAIAAPSAPAASSERPARVVESTPAAEPSLRSNEGARSSDVPPAPGPGQQGRPADSGMPAPTTPAPEENQPQPGTAGSAEKASPPAPAAGEAPLPTLPPEENRYKVQRPVLPAPASRVSRNVLEGKVVSGETGQPEEGVRLTVSSRAGAFVDRVQTTDAFGRYAIRLPDGDWTVKVTMPSGRTYSVSQITVSGGQITDDLGRNVPSLTITR
jgi:hypothetical protein